MDRNPVDIGRIVCEPDTLGGKPRLAGTRMSVEMVLEELAAGTTTDQLIEMFPFLTRADVQAVLKYVLGSIRHEAVFSIPEKAS